MSLSSASFFSFSAGSSAAVWVCVAAGAISVADAETLALHAAQLARVSAQVRVMDAVKDAVPEALAEWSSGVRQIAVDVDALLAQGATVDELAARRGSKTDVSRWEALTGFMAEYDRIRAAFGEARYVVNRSDQQDRFALNAAFKGVLESDVAAFRRELEASGHSLIAGVRLGWMPWCTTQREQLEDEQQTITARREHALRVPGDILVG